MVPLGEGGHINFILRIREANPEKKCKRDVSPEKKVRKKKKVHGPQKNDKKQNWFRGPKKKIKKGTQVWKKVKNEHRQRHQKKYKTEKGSDRPTKKSRKLNGATHHKKWGTNEGQYPRKHEKWSRPPQKKKKKKKNEKKPQVPKKEEKCENGHENDCYQKNENITKGHSYHKKSTKLKKVLATTKKRKKAKMASPKK